MTKNTHLCRCQAGFIKHAQDRFTLPAALLPGGHIGDLVKYQEFIISKIPGVQDTPNGNEATFEIVKVHRNAPDGTRALTLTLERVM